MRITDRFVEVKVMPRLKFHRMLHSQLDRTLREGAKGLSGEALDTVAVLDILSSYLRHVFNCGELLTHHTRYKNIEATM